METSSPGMARISSIGLVSVVVAATPAPARLASAVASVAASTVLGFTNTVTLNVAVAWSRRVEALVLLAVVTSHAPRPASSCIFTNACAHASFSFSAASAISTFLTCTPAIAASARSFTTALVFVSSTLARRVSRVSSACAFFSAASATIAIVSLDIGGGYGVDGGGGGGGGTSDTNTHVAVALYSPVRESHVRASRSANPSPHVAKQLAVFTYAPV
mmetsp:Transcript_10485/g.34686  ORF Transcript_10485/g.34686 Transcript_10485/m.34686 type:complete len:217 (+) Transcript_10485:185-835(+)